MRTRGYNWACLPATLLFSVATLSPHTRCRHNHGRVFMLYYAQRYTCYAATDTRPGYTHLFLHFFYFRPPLPPAFAVVGEQFTWTVTRLYLTFTTAATRAR